MSRNSDPGRVPDRWLHCPRKSSSLIAEKFLAFKTPLNKRFDSKVEVTYRFPPSMLLQSTKHYGYRVGLWIDLTNTTRFYDKSEVINGYDDDSEVRYLKISCQGHEATPTDDQVKLFISVCKNFISKEPKDIIGVHCTHGFNRTGFMIVCFLVEELDWGLEAALYEFTKAREPGIYKQDYLCALFQKYEPNTTPQRAPPRPAWCLEYDDDEDIPQETPTNRGEKRKHDSRKGDNRGKKRHHNDNKSPQFMEGVDGVHPVCDQTVISEVRTAAQDMCKWTRGGFPGSQPVSMDRENISYLSKEPYNVSWKADGTRYMMVILGENQVYMLDRDNSVYEVLGLRFVDRKNLDKHLTQTLLDGEMVIDRYQGANIPRYLVYDVICVNGIDVMSYPFCPARKCCIDVDIIRPRHMAIEQGKINKTAEPFSVRAKIFCTIDKAASFLGDKFSHQLTHEPDGLIFQPSCEGYVPGQSNNVLKWKPPSLNSIDFRLKVELEEGVGILTQKVGKLYVGGQSHPFGKMKMTKDLMKYDGKIVECRLDNNKWVFMRERTDKSFPNSSKTAISVLNSIRHPVTKDYLLDFIERHRFRSEREIMPPPPPPSRVR